MSVGDTHARRFSYAVTYVARPFVPPANLGAAHEDVTFTTSDGLELDGWYVPSKNGAAVIAFPRSQESPAGGEMMLQAAAQTDDLAAVVSEGAGTRTFADETDSLSSSIGGPEFLLAYPFLAVKTGAIAVFSNTMPPPKLTSLVPASHLVRFSGSCDTSVGA